MGGKTVVEASKTTNEPWGPAQEPLIKGLNASVATYDANQPMLQRASTQLQGAYDRLAPGAEQGISGAQSLVNRNLSGANLTGNPYLEGIISQTRNNTREAVNEGFIGAGQSALGGRRAQMLTRELADAEGRLRYQDYGTERGYQQDAIGQSQDLMRGSQSLLENSTMLPYAGVSALNGNVRQASAGYGSTTSNSTRKESGDPLGAIMGLGGLGLKAFSTFSDDRMKENIKPVGMLPDGVGVFNYNFKGEDARRMGVLASDVAAKRPDALGPQVGGMQTVDYGALGPEGAMLAKSAGPVEGMGGAMPNLTAPKIESAFNMPGGTRDKLGELGDLLLAYTGNPIGMAGLQAKSQKSAAEQAEAMYARRRADENADWQSRADYERDNPKPVNNDTVADYNFILQNQGKAAADLYLKSRYDPIVNIPLPGGDAYVGPRSGMGGWGQGQAAPQMPVRPKGKLTPYNGGATGNPSGNFR